jgi:hypothetical protein
MLQTRRNWHQQGHERDTTITLVREREEYKEPSYRKEPLTPFHQRTKDNQYSSLPAINHPQNHHHHMHKKFAEVATAKQASKQTNKQA